MDVMGYDEATERIRENIDYDIIARQYPQERVNEIVDLAAEMLCSCRAVYKLGGDTYPRKLVQERLLRLDSEHIGYIIGCIDKHTGDVRNIKQYLMKTLINAPATMGATSRRRWGIMCLVVAGRSECFAGRYREQDGCAVHQCGENDRTVVQNDGK